MADDLLQQAAAQQQSPDAPVPLPTNPAGVILGAGAPPVQPQGGTVSAQPTVQQPTQAQPTPDQQIQAHHSAIGQAISHFAHALEGKQVNYVTDPQTGDVTSIVQPRKAGGFFRDLLLGAIAGGAAASEKVPEGSGGLVGLTRGAQAGLQVGPQQQVLRYSAAQSKGKEIQTANARQLEQAAIADDTVSSLNLGHFVGVHSAQELNQYNQSVNTVKESALQNGGQVAHLDGTVKNGEKGNGPAMMALVNAHPEIMVGPDGMHRAVFITHDLPDGTSHDGEKWTDADGQHPDWNANATVTLVDIPSAIWGKQLSLPNKTWNAAAGRDIAKGDPDKTSQGTFGSLFSLGLRSKKDILAARTERERGPRTEDEALEWTAAGEDADKTSPGYTLIQSRAKKGQAFLDAKEAEKKESKTAPLVDSPEKAQASLTDAQIALQNAQRANPKDPTIPALQQAVKDAQKRYDDQSNAAKKKNDESPKTLNEAAVSLANAKFADSQESTPETKKALAQAQAVYDGSVNAKKDELQAEYQTQLRLASGKADAERKAKEDYDRNLYQNVLASGDQTGWKPAANQLMTEQQFNAAKEKFADSILSKGEDTDKSYQMFQDAYNQYKAAGGKLPTGAQSMLALSTHLSTTFGNVKGSRVTKDMIQEHLGARSVPDNALVAVQRLVSGDVLSPKQWAAFNDLITDSRNKQWDNAVSNAHYRGLPADFLPEDRRVAPAAQPAAPQNQAAARQNRNAAPRTNTTPNQTTFDPSQFPKAQ